MSITASRTRSRIVIGIGRSGPLVTTKPRIGKAGRSTNRPARGMYSGEGGYRHLRLALALPDSRRCGIFFRHNVSSLVPSGRAACGDFGNQARQSSDRVKRKAGVADLSAP